MKKIYVVYTENVEYDNYYWDFIYAYSSEQKAKERVTKLNLADNDFCYYYGVIPFDDAEGDHHES